jgi:hypothetical protein
MIVSENESAKGWFRCERFVVSDRNWRYVTREGSQVGPFHCKKDAEKGKFYAGDVLAREVCRARHW